MADNNLAEAGEIVFSEYPEQMDKYFQNKKLVVKTFPNRFQHLREAQFPDFEITSARQCYDFIEEELKFWDDKDIRNKSCISTFYSKLTNAKSNFNSAKMYYESNQEANARSFMDSLYGHLNQEYLYSKTKLAQFLKGFKARDNHFFTGLDIALCANPANQLPDNYVGTHIGFAIGLEYLKVVQSAQTMAKEELDKFLENVKIASGYYAELNKRYTAAFHEQKKRIEEIKQQNDDAIKNLETKSAAYFSERDKRSADLEQLYGEKLALSQPANYWKTLAKAYRNQGIVLVSLASVLSLLIIVGLVVFAIIISNQINQDSTWFELVKSSAVTTVIAGIAIYVLRILIKMTLSSFHLSRDATERRLLSYFYLALNKQKAVSEKERALIINSLFSRADTGLLKDSAPTMTENVVDLLKK